MVAPKAGDEPVEGRPSRVNEAVSNNVNHLRYPKRVLRHDPMKALAVPRPHPSAPFLAEAPKNLPIFTMAYADFFGVRIGLQPPCYPSSLISTSATVSGVERPLTPHREVGEEFPAGR